MSSGKRKIIIDCDAGTDDATAIIMALADQNVEVLAITCVFGNTDVDQVCTNVLRVLKLCKRLDIPVYRGCEVSLLGVGSNAKGYHGKDGLGDVPDADPPCKDLLQKQHAVMALIDLVEKHKDEVTLVPLGPLTNIAMALRFQPSFGTMLHRCVIMGGNTQGRGNITTTAEFNTFSDPEAALVVLNELTDNLYLLPLDTCLDNPLSSGEYDKIYRSSRSSQKARQMAGWQELCRARNARNGTSTFGLFDQLAMAVATNDSIIVERKHLYGTVELFGSKTRGQMVWDWEGNTGEKPNVHLVTKINGEN